MTSESTKSTERETRRSSLRELEEFGSQHTGVSSMELSAFAFLLSWLAFWGCWIGFRLEMKKRQAIEDAHREDTARQLRELSASVVEGIAFQKQVLKQGEETVALLNAIKDNLEHRSK